MSARILMDDAEIVKAEDLTAIGVEAQSATDAIAEDAIGYPAHWANFTVAQASIQEVDVSSGRYFQNDEVFRADQTTRMNLQQYFPLAASDERWIALVLRGTEVTVSEQRDFETSTDIETSIPVQQTTPKRVERQASVVVQVGSAVPPPAARPIIANTDACVAFVRTTSQGIQEVVPGEDKRVKSLYEVEGRLVIVEANLLKLVDRTASIETDVANIADQLGDIPRPAIIEQMQRDIGAAGLQLELGDDPRAYFFDNALIPDRWDQNHPDWLAFLEEGIRFASAAERDAQLALIDESNPAIRFQDRRMMPAWTEVPRITNEGSPLQSIDISQRQNTVVNATKREVSRERLTYGPSFTTCENRAGWANIANRRPGEMLTVNGETFIVDAALGTLGYGAGHQHFNVRKVRRERYTETYWDYDTQTIGLNGSIYGQTFLCAQPMILTSIDLNFDRVGASGDVHLLLCETDDTAAPRFDQVIASTTKIRGDLSLGWNNFPLEVTLLESGKRYGFFVVTTGNHALSVSTDNAFTGGSLFLITDGAFAQGDTTRDLAFQVNAARFDSPRTVVPFQPLSLANGMTEIDLLYKGWVPGGTRLEWEYRPSGATNWTVIGPEDDAPMTGLPALVELRAVMVGTADLQPMIVVDAVARGRTRRPRMDFVGVTEDVQFGISSDTIRTTTVLDNFDPAVHTFSPTIIAGGATVLPDVVTVTVDPNRAERRTVRAIYNLLSPVTSARLRPTGTTSNAVSVYHIESDFMAAI